MASVSLRTFLRLDTTVPPQGSPGGGGGGGGLTGVCQGWWGWGFGACMLQASFTRCLASIAVEGPSPVGREMGMQCGFLPLALGKGMHHAGPNLCHVAWVTKVVAGCQGPVCHPQVS